VTRACFWHLFESGQGRPLVVRGMVPGAAAQRGRRRLGLTRARALAPRRRDLGAAGDHAVLGLDVWAGHETPTIFLLAVFGSFISYIYSAPPLKLKQSGWAGNYALGSSYIALPWWAGQARRASGNQV